jgi:hypothetical protein
MTAPYDVPLAVVIPATMGKKGEVPLVEVSTGATPTDGSNRSQAPPVSFLRLFRFVSCSLLKLLSSAASTDTCASTVVALIPLLGLLVIAAMLHPWIGL